MLLTMDEARGHLRMESGVDDAMITLYVGAAEATAQSFLGRTVYATQSALDTAADEDGIVINDAIKAGILLILGHLYENREDVVVGAAVNQLPMASQYVLQPYSIRLGV